ncbi:hypothetical protein GJAV_G00164860 [Gymnothorax javanicus]|nr:hypothetical protein GJAV_G00164860 [Gymnothorax javanicus]
MPTKKTTKDKKRKTLQSEEGNADRKRRSPGSSVEDVKEDLEPPRSEEPSDIEEGGLDLSVQFKPISAYISDRHEMLEQCFRVLGENKLKKMLPDELKSCTFEEIKQLCWEQLEQLSEGNLVQILEGGEGTAEADEDEDRKKPKPDSQQDNNVDSTSSLKETAEAEDSKQGGGSGEESDVLSINADMYDSDIEGHKEEVSEKPEGPVAAVSVAQSEPDPLRPADPKRDLQKDIEKSVCEILALASSPVKETPGEPAEPPVCETPPVRGARQGLVMATVPRLVPAPAVSQPSAQQLELLELEMRARAIKALMKANEAKKQSCG